MIDYIRGDGNSDGGQKGYNVDDLYYSVDILTDRSGGLNNINIYARWDRICAAYVVI